MNVYFIEDNPKFFQEVKKTIEGHLGWVRVIRWTTGDILDSETHMDSSGLLFMDLDLPGQNSLGLFDDIRSKTDIPIVVIDDVEFGAGRIMKALRLGASDYILKPVHNSRLIATVLTHSMGEKYALSEVK